MYPFGEPACAHTLSPPGASVVVQALLVLLPLPYVTVAYGGNSTLRAAVSLSVTASTFATLNGLRAATLHWL